MSLEKDITTLRQIMEAEPVFKPASKENLVARKEALKKKALEAGILPVTQEISKLCDEYWAAEGRLRSALDVLPRGSEECNCDWEKIEDAGEQDEWTTLPGDKGYAEGRCMRCGGWKEIN